MIEVLQWLGLQISPSKVTLDSKDVVVLGIRIVSTPKARMFCVPEDKADAILPVLSTLRNNASSVLQTDLETCVGRLAFLAYLSTWGSRYTYPLYAIQWIPLVDRTRFISRDTCSPLAAEIRRCLDWWITLLTSDLRILWSSLHDPQQWIIVNSDACLHGWCATDYNGNLFAGGILDSTKKAISIYEMMALRKYIEWAKPNVRTGIVFLCDNTNVIHTVRKGYSKSITLRHEYNKFADLCEIMSIKCICKYVASKRNMMTDLGSRCRPLLAAAVAASLRECRASAGDKVSHDHPVAADEDSQCQAPALSILRAFLSDPSAPLKPIALDMTPSMLGHAMMEAEGRWPLITD